MTTVYVSSMMNAPTEEVWAYIRDFNVYMNGFNTLKAQYGG